MKYSLSAALAAIQVAASIASGTVADAQTLSPTIEGEQLNRRDNAFHASVFAVPIKVSASGLISGHYSHSSHASHSSHVSHYSHYSGVGSGTGGTSSGGSGGVTATPTCAVPKLTVWSRTSSSIELLIANYDPAVTYRVSVTRGKVRFNNGGYTLLVTGVPKKTKVTFTVTASKPACVSSRKVLTASTR